MDIEKDDIDRVFKDSFDSFEPEVPSDAWSAIASGLGHSEAGRPIPVRRLVQAIAAVAACLVVFMGERLLFRHAEPVAAHHSRVVGHSQKTAAEIVAPKPRITLEKGSKVYVKAHLRPGRKQSTVILIDTLPSLSQISHEEDVAIKTEVRPEIALEPVSALPGIITNTSKGGEGDRRIFGSFRKFTQKLRKGSSRILNVQQDSAGNEHYILNLGFARVTKDSNSLD